VGHPALERVIAVEPWSETENPVPRRGTRALALGNRALMEELGARVAALDTEVASLLNTGRTVMFIAIDGTLAAAIAVGDPIKKSTPEALESAQVTLVKGDFNGIVRARQLSRATVRNIRQNLGFVFGYNILGIPIAAGILYPSFGLLLSPMIAALAMSLSSICVIGNALRLQRAADVHQP